MALHHRTLVHMSESTLTPRFQVNGYAAVDRAHGMRGPQILHRLTFTCRLLFCVRDSNSVSGGSRGQNTCCYLSVFGNCRTQTVERLGSVGEGGMGWRYVLARIPIWWWGYNLRILPIGAQSGASRTSTRRPLRQHSGSRLELSKAEKRGSCYRYNVTRCKMTWPAYSADMNCMENVWSILKRDISNRAQPPMTIQALQTAAVRNGTTCARICPMILYFAFHVGYQRGSGSVEVVHRHARPGRLAGENNLPGAVAAIRCDRCSPVKDVRRPRDSSCLIAASALALQADIARERNMCLRTQGTGLSALPIRHPGIDARRGAVATHETYDCLLLTRTSPLPRDASQPVTHRQGALLGLQISTEKDFALVQRIAHKEDDECDAWVVLSTLALLDKICPGWRNT
ncbi:hypothetical protein PR048_024569 [Dryococelus australis]|uniref:Transposase n=1 Tax=Dryococelus australis TaxID=614101 RepID=A0ABQ9GNX7_9NEOP|nr:hypothetical protein PR048_024569 [Dryococelus australis]